MVVTSIDELNQREDWFRDLARSAEENRGPFVLVEDNFYAEPEKIRAIALQQEFVQYSPPEADQVGDETARKYQRANPAGTWLSTSLHTFHFVPVRSPVRGFRFSPDWLRERISLSVHQPIPSETWELGGGWWNGAFHLRNDAYGLSSIHHHYKTGDVEPRGWSGVVYLSPDAPKASGTSIWRDRRTGHCVAEYGAAFHEDESSCDLAFVVENRFNRLVLFRENVWHRAERAFGQGTDARLVQTFFFVTGLNASGQHRTASSSHG